MNQRVGKWKPAAMNDRNGFGQIKFFQRCADELHDVKEDEAAFYFEQLVDHLREGGSLSPDDAVRALGL